MSAHEYSPAPWETSRDAVPAGHVQITVYDADGCRVATVFAREANAHLIKASPALLEALREALDWNADDIRCNKREEIAPSADMLKCRAKVLRSAIAAAEGKS